MKTHKLSDKISGKYFEIIESLKSESCLLFHSFVEFNFIVGVTARVVWDIFKITEIKSSGRILESHKSES